jgi:hypothetical protein
MRLPYLLGATVTAVVLLTTPGCSKLVTGSASRDSHAPRPKNTECEQVSAPLTAIDSRAAGEPQLKIPQPTGWERAALVDRLGATDLHIPETTRCGGEAELVDYDAPAMGRIPPRTVTTLMVAGAFKGNTYVATVTVQSTDPDNPVYARDTGTVRFQMLAPGGG